MKRLQRQLVLNKAEDWRAAYCWGVVPEGDSLTLAPGAGSFAYGVWIAGKRGFPGAGCPWTAGWPRIA